MAGEGYSLPAALSLAGRQTMDSLVICRALSESETGRMIALGWRDTDPRGPNLPHLAGTLRTERPEGVSAVD